MAALWHHGISCCIVEATQQTTITCRMYSTSFNDGYLCSFASRFSPNLAAAKFDLGTQQNVLMRCDGLLSGSLYSVAACKAEPHLISINTGNVCQRDDRMPDALGLLGGNGVARRRQPALLANRVMPITVGCLTVIATESR